MRGFPKYFNSKEDYKNVIRDDINRKQAINALYVLLRTSKRGKPIYPDDTGPKTAKPIFFETVDNPNGRIFLLGFTVDEVKELIGLVENVYPFYDSAKLLIKEIKSEEFEKAKSITSELVKTAWLPEFIASLLNPKSRLMTALDDYDNETALSEAECLENAINDLIDGKLSQC